LKSAGIESFLLKSVILNIADSIDFGECAREIASFVEHVKKALEIRLDNFAKSGSKMPHSEG